MICRFLTCFPTFSCGGIPPTFENNEKILLRNFHLFFSKNWWFLCFAVIENSIPSSFYLFPLCLMNFTILFQIKNITLFTHVTFSALWKVNMLFMYMMQGNLSCWWLTQLITIHNISYSSTQHTSVFIIDTFIYALSAIVFLPRCFSHCGEIDQVGGHLSRCSTMIRMFTIAQMTDHIGFSQSDQSPGLF